MSYSLLTPGTNKITTLQKHSYKQL